MTEIFLIRHCSAVGQAEDAELTTDGVSQATILADILVQEKIRRIISSPFLRAVSSAQPTADLLGLTIEIDPRLAERELGVISDGNWMEALGATFEDPILCFPQGESSALAAARGREAVDEVLNDKIFPAAIFTHGNLLTLIARSFDERIGFTFWRELRNPDIVRLTRVEGRLTVQKVKE